MSGRFALLTGTVFAALTALAPGQRLILPTPNDALLQGDNPSFYMYTDRYVDGENTRPWQGGTYGYCRNPRQTASGVVYSRFHEGIDIAPVSRSSTGEPLDAVVAIAPGRVAYACVHAGRSNYGRYVVVEHAFPSGPFYSLYAHLAKVDVSAGQKLATGQKIGILGYTGRGLNQRRAHVHLELNLMVHRDFNRWYARHYSEANHHGIHNGINLAGIDIAALYRSQAAGRVYRLKDFISRMRPYYRVAVPNTGRFDMLKRHPWLWKSGAMSAPSYEITLSSSGIPLAVRARTGKAPPTPLVTWVRPSPTPHTWNTRSRLTGSGASASLTGSGRRYVELLAGMF